VKWWIQVSGYGSFEFEGSESEAEEMRVHKARWEGGIARKWKIESDGKIVIPEGKPGPHAWDVHHGVQLEILATEVATAMASAAYDNGQARADAEYDQAYRGLSRTWWWSFWAGWDLEGLSFEGVAQDTGALAREIYDSNSKAY